MAVKGGGSGGAGGAMRLVDRSVMKVLSVIQTCLGAARSLASAAQRGISAAPSLRV